MRILKSPFLMIFLGIFTLGCEWERQYNYGHRRRHLLFRTSRAMFSPLDTLNVDDSTMRDLESIRYKRPNKGDMQFYTAPNWNARMKNNPELHKNSTSYRLSRGSSFDLEVVGEEEISHTYVVSGDGDIGISLLSGDDNAERIRLAGKTLQEAAETIRDKLKKYIINPQVNINPVLVKQKESDTFVNGEVIMLGAFGDGDGDRPSFLGGTTSRVTGSTPMAVVGVPNDRSFFKLMAASGGLSSEADIQNIVVMRKINDELNIIVVDMQRLTQFADLSQNIDVADGDIIYVPLRENSFGEQFAYEWGTILNYVAGLITFDFAIEQFKEHDSFGF